MKILAIDLGGTSAKIALFNGKKILKKLQVPTDKKNLWENIKNNLSGIEDSDYDIVSISMPGFIDHEKGIVTLSGNLSLKDYEIQKNVEKVFKNKKIYSINDANAAALGEYWQGAAASDSSTILYTLGTGVGGGIVVNGKLVYGHQGYAGELGHGGYFQDKWPCTCGLKNCIEPISSATGMKRLLKEAGHNISLKEAGQLLKGGDPDIKKIFIESLSPLANHICVMQTAINPESIVIGGGPSNIGEPLRKLIEELVNERQLDFIAKSTKILLATTKNEAGMFGAAFWALTQEKHI